jgi:dihydroorotate dehydrogenase
MYELLRPLLFSLSPANAHAMAMTSLGLLERAAPLRALAERAFAAADPRLEVRAMGLVFPNPLGVAAGLDKNAERPRALASLGFGHLELGTVTARAQEANPAPNLFRLPADHALLNRLGFPNHGARAVSARLAASKASLRIPVGVSIGKSRLVPIEPIDEALEDYIESFREVIGVADFVVVNISSPNTKDLRALQASDIARTLFTALRQENASIPLLVKIAPDLSDDAIDAVCDEAMRAGLAGVVATNTTVSREGLKTPIDVVERLGLGGLSGRPLRERSLGVVRRVRARLGPEAVVIGVGGIDDAASALAMLRAGANLVQMYTGLVYEGPGLARRILRELLQAMNAANASSLAELLTHG